MRDLDELLGLDVSLVAARAAQPFDFTLIERRAARRSRNRALLALSAAAAAVVLVAVGSLQVASSRGASPTVPVQQPTPSPTPGWTGPLRPGTSLPKVPAASIDPSSGISTWADGAEAAAAAIDILELRAGGSRRLEWRLSLRGAPHDGAPGDPHTRAVEYGFVVDADGDQDADCEIGINDNAEQRPGYRTWVRNPKTGAQVEEVGPPYGYPFDFAGLDRPGAREVVVFFIGGDFPWKTWAGRFPCPPFRRSATFYAWALLTQDGRPTAWDFAPDAAWLQMPPSQAE